MGCLEADPPPDELDRQNQEDETGQRARMAAQARIHRTTRTGPLPHHGEGLQVSRNIMKNYARKRPSHLV